MWRGQGESVLSGFREKCIFCKIPCPTFCLKCHMRCCEKCVDRLEHTCEDALLGDINETSQWTVVAPKGIENLGTTCYMASAMQILLNSPILFDYFVSNAYKPDINKQNILGNKGEAANLFASLCWDYKNTKASKWYQMHSFFKKYAHMNDLFSDPFLQHDGQEFLSDVLDRLHEDLNVAPLENGRKKYTEFKDRTSEETDEEVANRFLKFVSTRDDSMIHDIFGGLYKNDIQCLKCQYKTCQFERFCLVPLPLPNEIRCIVQVLFFPLPRGTSPRLLRVGLPLGSKTMDLVGEVSGITGVHERLLIMATPNADFKGINLILSTEAVKRENNYQLRKAAAGDINGFTSIMYCYQDNLPAIYDVHQRHLTGATFTADIDGSPGWRQDLFDTLEASPENDSTQGGPVPVRSIAVVLDLSQAVTTAFPIVFRIPIKASLDEVRMVAISALQEMAACHSWKRESSRELSPEAWTHPDWMITNALNAGLDKMLLHIQNERPDEGSYIQNVQEFTEKQKHFRDGDYGEYNALKSYLNFNDPNDRATESELAMNELREYKANVLPRKVDAEKAQQVRNAMERELTQELKISCNNYVIHGDYVLNKLRGDIPIARYVGTLRDGDRMVQINGNSVQSVEQNNDILLTFKHTKFDCTPTSVPCQFKGTLPDIYGLLDQNVWYQAADMDGESEDRFAYRLRGQPEDAEKEDKEFGSPDEIHDAIIKLHRLHSNMIEERNKSRYSVFSQEQPIRSLPFLSLPIDGIIDTIDLHKVYKETGLATFTKFISKRYLNAYSSIHRDQNYREHDTSDLQKSPTPIPMWSMDSYVFINPRILSKPCLPSHHGIGITDLLKDAQSPEVMSGEGSWKCEKCSSQEGSSKTHSIWSCGPNLLINLKRFSFMSNSGVSRKNTATFEYPENGIMDLSEYIQSADEALYEIYAAIIHSGTLESGHYVTLVKSGDGWHCVDDEVVREIDRIDLQIGNAYTIALRRVCRKSGDSQVRSQISTPMHYPPPDLLTDSSPTNHT